MELLYGKYVLLAYSSLHMRYNFQDPNTQAVFNLWVDEPKVDWNMYTGDNPNLMAILWNRGPAQQLTVDHESFDFPANSLVSLSGNQIHSLSRSEDVVVWQFNREFYCIIDHDQEVSCVGLLFYGSQQLSFVKLDAQEGPKFDLLFKVFIDEYGEKDNLQAEMLRMLLKRLIVKLTRLYKTQTEIQAPVDELDEIRQFNLLVEKSFKQYHQVQDFAQLMHKSPKTLSNLFAKHYDKTPLQVIHERIIREAKRLLIYTDQSMKEIAFETGFEEVSHFSRFFKKTMDTTPMDFRKLTKSKG